VYQPKLGKIDIIASQTSNQNQKSYILQAAAVAGEIVMPQP